MGTPEWASAEIDADRGRSSPFLPRPVQGKMAMVRVPILTLLLALTFGTSDAHAGGHGVIRGDRVAAARHGAPDEGHQGPTRAGTSRDRRPPGAAAAESDGVAVASPTPVDARHATQSGASAGRIATGADGGESTRSIGYAHRGRLSGGLLLEATANLRFKDGTPDGERYGTAELVRLIAASADHVATVVPGLPLTVGDLSRRRGGRFGRHRSHRSGRDVDLVYYTLDDAGHPALPEQMIGFRRSGIGRDRAGLRYHFDDTRNWALVAFLIDNDIAAVQRIFLSRTIKRRLLAHAQRSGAAASLIERAAAVLDNSGGRHHDHMHVRIFCPAGDRPECRDRPPFWPWHPEPEASQGESQRESASAALGHGR